MKKLIILKTILLIGILTSCKTFHSKSEKENFNYFSRKSTLLDFKNLDRINRKWREINKDTIIYTTYFKAAVCDIPNEGEMSIKISNDTLYFNFGLANISPDCEREIGVAGIMVDFVLNKKNILITKSLKLNILQDETNSLHIIFSFPNFFFWTRY